MCRRKNSLNFSEAADSPMLTDIITWDVKQSTQAQGRRRLVPLPAAIPSSDETGRYAWISRSAGFCPTGSGWPAGPTLQWARPQPTEPHVVRHTYNMYNLRRHETVDPILNSYSGHTRLMITLPTELWSNNWENKVGYNRASCIIS